MRRDSSASGSVDIGRWILSGAVIAGVLGAVGGLVIGLVAYAPTAWFAVFELGLPCAIAGGAVGALAAGVTVLFRRIRH